MIASNKGIYSLAVIGKLSLSNRPMMMGEFVFPLGWGFKSLNFGGILVFTRLFSTNKVGFKAKFWYELLPIGSGQNGQFRCGYYIDWQYQNSLVRRIWLIIQQIKLFTNLQEKGTKPKSITQWKYLLWSYFIYSSNSTERVE